MSGEIALKRGASFVVGLAFTNDDGTAKDMTGATYSCQLRDGDGTLIATPAIVMTNPAGGIGHIAEATAAWPEGILKGDLRVTQAAVVIYSDTFAVRVLTPVTE